jgi:hypothetical protein
MIPALKHWHPMTTAPKDGTIFIALHRAYNAKEGTPQVQACQYFCNEFGMDWRWRSPWRTGTSAYADAWMTLEEFAEWQDRGEPSEPVEAKPAAPAPAPAQDFDL